jgi:hypothetical protein
MLARCRCIEQAATQGDGTADTPLLDGIADLLCDCRSAAPACEAVD